MAARRYARRSAKQGKRFKLLENEVKNELDAAAATLWCCVSEDETDREDAAPERQTLDCRASEGVKPVRVKLPATRSLEHLNLVRHAEARTAKQRRVLEARTKLPVPTTALPPLPRCFVPASLAHSHPELVINCRLNKGPYGPPFRGTTLAADKESWGTDIVLPEPGAAPNPITNFNAAPDPTSEFQYPAGIHNNDNMQLDPN